ncbi:MAG: T9SS type A sorting domain-containing protein [Candidatus Cloacimonadota bacterium]|nr:T9SS type A sorting domain-containing protein [Candidatus Cloacimonadota bacterium]
MKKILILIMLIITSMLFSNTYIVLQNGNGDFTTIQGAVNGVSAGDEIIVFDGTYYEDIIINTHSLTLKSFSGPEDCIISGNTHCLTVNLPMEKIEGFTIKNASNTALVIQGGLSELKNCIFEDNEKTGMPLIGGSAITAWKPFEELSDCIFQDNDGPHTVVIHCDYPLGQPFPEVNETIKNNIFLDNTNSASYPINGKDISLMNASINNYHGVLENNTFKGSTGGIYVEGIYGNADLNISNCVFDGSGISDDLFDQDLVIINYSCFSNNGYQNTYTWEDGNLTNTDPELNSSTYQPLWNSSVKSPCIDTGDPSIIDNDGTPSDIGAVCAITHKYDIVELPSPEEDNNGWKWLSFPALDNVLDEADIAENVLAGILDPTILDKVYSENYIIQYDDVADEWEHDYEQFSRTEGFKFYMNAAADLDVPGFKEYDNTTIVLDGNTPGNWVGYWLEETQHVSDAFSDYWDASNIYFIQHQNWTAFYLGRWRIELYSGDEPTLSYGDMVIVKCYNTINNFQWNSGSPTIRTLIAETEYFTYEEQAGYIPLYIELDSGNMPQEIGAFVNGECIGAAVVGDTLIQINAYTTSVPPGDIELELYYGGRSENQNISSYNCVTSSKPDIIMKQLSTKDKDDAWFINLREGSEVIPEIIEFSASNYPNPFNPTTTISYSLPLEGEVSLNIYNVKGQLVRQLIDGSQPEGHYEVVWNGKDSNEKSVSSGIYFYKLSTKDDTIMKKMLMLK